MTGADALVAILKAEGVQQAFCYPTTPILEALARGGVRTLLARQERVAGNMADGVARSTGGRQLGVLTVQQSAGSENAFAPIAQAYTDSSPLLFIPGHPGLRQAGIPPAFDGLAHYGAATKLALQPTTADQIPQRARMAITALRSGRPGPVMLEMPVDVAAEEFTGPITHTPVRPIKSAADPGAVEEAAERLLRSASPLIWAGQGVLYADASAELQAVAELLGAPVMTTLQGKSAFNERHELSAGVGAYVETGMVAHYLAHSDTLLAVGTSLSLAPFTPQIPDGKTIVHATNDPTDLHKIYPADVAICADAKLFLAQLADVLRSRVGAAQEEMRRRTVARLAELRTAWRADFAAEFNDERDPINGYRLFGELWSLMDPDTSMITHESGACRDIQCVFYESTVPHSYLGWGQSSQLGFSLGLAMGAKLANPDKLVVNVMGDGAAGMTGMDWETAARENIPILSVIKNDAIFSGYDRNIPTAIEKFSLSTLYGDYAGVAAALGCHAEKVTALHELRPALQRAIRATREGQPAVVDVTTAETRRLSAPPPERKTI